MAEKQEVGSTDEVSGKGFQIQTENETQNQIPTFGFDVKSEKCDIVLIVENQRLYARRYVLEYASPVFEGMFEEKLQETNELRIDGVKCNDFAEFLACIQPRKKHKISMDNVFRMLELAEKYKVEDLKKQCEFCLLIDLETCQNKNISITELLSCACKFGLMELIKICVAKAAELPIHETTSNEVFKKLPPETKCELYEQILPSLVLKSHFADFMLKLCTKEEEGLIGLFTDVKVTKISCTSTYSNAIVHKFVLWDIGWSLNVHFFHQHGSYRRLIFSHDDEWSWKTLKCHIGIVYVIQNHIPWNDHSSKQVFFTYDFPTLTSYIIPIDEKNLEDKASGFSHKGVFTMDVYVLMNKPSYEKLPY